MIICAYFAHYITLKALPSYSVDTYIYSNTNTCRVYSKRSWDVVGEVRHNNSKLITITNGVIEVEGYLYEL